MTSQINHSLINTSYPVAGQDNNSQGFRDNFTAIATGLAQAGTEITALQQNAVIVADLATSSNTVQNNLLGSGINNGTYKQLNPKVYALGTVSLNGVSVDLVNGPVQTASASANGVFTLHNLGPGGSYSSVKLIVTGTGASSITITNATTAVFKAATGYTGTNAGSSVTHPITTGKTEVLEIWSTDAGANIFIRNVGQY